MLDYRKYGVCNRPKGLYNPYSKNIGSMQRLFFKGEDRFAFV